MNTRRYKVTCYIEVPIKFGQSIKSESDMENLISEKLFEEGLYADVEVDKMPLPDELEEPYGEHVEDITDFESPVGFIAPDGKFYGMEDGIEGLAHLALAHEIYEYYKDIVGDYKRSSYGIDYDLESMGFIKIHGCTIRYSFHSSHPKYWTDAQKSTVYRYMKEMEERDSKIEHFHGPSIDFDGIGDNSGLKWSHEFRQMDDIAIMSCFT